MKAEKYNDLVEELFELHELENHPELRTEIEAILKRYIAIDKPKEKKKKTNDSSWQYEYDHRNDWRNIKEMGEF